MTAFLALLASAIVGVSDVTGGLASRTRDAAANTAVLHAVALPVLVVAAALRGAPGIHGTDVAAGLAVGVVTGIGYIWFFTALAAGSVAIVVPVTASVAVTTPVVVSLIAGERLPATGWIGVGACALAVPLCSVGEAELAHPHRVRWSPVRQATVAATTGVGFGSFYAVMGHTSSTSGTWPAVAVVLSSLAVTTVVATARARRTDPSAPPDPVADTVPDTVPDVVTGTDTGPSPLALLVVSGLCLGLGDVLNTLALQRGPVAVASVLGNLYPLFAVLVAYLGLREHVLRPQVAGLALGVVGAMLISAVAP